MVSFSFSLCGLCVHVQLGVDIGCLPLLLPTLVFETGLSLNLEVANGLAICVTDAV